MGNKIVNIEDLFVEIVENKLYGIGGILKIDESITWVPPNHSGYQPSSCYLIIEQRQALLVDTGVAAHRKMIIDHLNALSDKYDTLSIFLTRREADSLGNLEEIVRLFNVGKIIGTGSAQNPIDFFPSLDVNLFDEKIPGDIIYLSEDRKLICYEPPIRMLTTIWLYDEQLGVLFTSDCFTHRAINDNNSRYVVESLDDHENSIFTEYLYTRYGWMKTLEGNKKSADILNDIFRNDVKFIAPAHGCVMKGKGVVNYNYKLMLDRFV